MPGDPFLDRRVAVARYRAARVHPEGARRRLAREPDPHLVLVTNRGALRPPFGVLYTFWHEVQGDPRDLVVWKGPRPAASNAVNHSAQLTPDTLQAGNLPILRIVLTHASNPSGATHESPLRHRTEAGFFQNAPEGIQNPNLLIRSQMLYPLSYGREIFSCVARMRWRREDLNLRSGVGRTTH